MAVKKRLGEMLVEAGIIDETQLHAALGHQRQWGGRLGAILVELKLASEETIVEALSRKFGFEVARLDRLEPYAFEQARALLPKEYVVRNRVFPMAADTSLLVVAMSDPTNLSMTDELAFRTGRRVKVCIAGENAIAAAVRATYGEESSPQREAIALDVSDDTAVEPLYDPIGATSSEELNRFFQQPAAASPAHATRPAVRTPASAAPPPAAPAAARSAQPPPSELQLEDQPTGSIPLESVEPFELGEELQPIPLEPEAAGQEAAPAAEPPWDAGEAAPAADGWVEGQVEGQAGPRELTPEESLLLEAIWRMAAGDETAPAVVKPAQLLACLVRLMMRKQWITEQELLDEILHG